METLFFHQNKPMFIQIYDHIKRNIANGSLHPGAKLPSKRKLALLQNVSINTVESAYTQLEAEGYVKSIPRRGWFVLEFEPGVICFEEKPAPADSEPETVINGNVIDFSQTVDTAKFPYAQWKKCSAEALDHEELYHTGHPFGEAAFRREIARYLHQTRGVRCRSNQVIVGCGTQMLLGKISRMLKDSCIAVEDPGYHRTRQTLSNHRIEPIALDESGIQAEALAKTPASAVYVTPSHQFPLGTVMPVQRRMELLNWSALRSNAWIIEDDYDGEFRYEGKPIPSLHSLSENGDVLYLGTFSKTFIPSLRISYAVLPLKLLESGQEELMTEKQTVSRFHQHALSIFMANGWWEQHLNRMRTHYRKKHSLLLKHVNEVFKGDVRFIGEKSGTHFLLEVMNGMSEAELIASASQHGVKVYPTSPYYIHSQPDRPLIFLGFGGVTEEEIKTGMLLLRKAWFDK
ncbi:PLP-dependent aminotransferase family protein [Metabacillus sp. 113a]|uniref:MocR-like pyridoxine biosynthesis transcription factor PdxR n=1 Tax=Metabacillus sp. 113a TaxID=3404706 RepID=UPI003CEB3EA5